MSEPILYGLYLKIFNLRYNKRKSIPRPNDKYFVDGYPRCGNTFTKGLINYCHPQLIANYHFHTLAPLKIALKNNLKTLILFRDPAECVSSLILMEDFEVYQGGKEIKNVVNQRLDDFNRYYSFVLDNSLRIHLLPFFKITSNEICLFLELFFELPFSQEDWNAFIKVNENVQKGKSPNFSMLPNDEKQRMKEDVKSFVYDSPKFEKSNVIFKELQALADEDFTN